MTDFERPHLTVDVVAFRWRRRLEVLLIRRGKPPFQGQHALPGGFVEPFEPAPVAAVRELREETGVHIDPETLRTVGTFSGPDRDPRGWTASAVYAAVLSPDVEAAAGDDAAAAEFVDAQALPLLAFDHAQVIAAARRVLIERVQVEPWPLTLLGHGFRSAQVRALYAAILGEPVAPRPLKAWLRRRGAVTRVGVARFSPSAELRPDWLR